MNISDTQDVMIIKKAPLKIWFGISKDIIKPDIFLFFLHFYGVAIENYF